MNYFYAKERRKFGRQCLFAEQNKVLVNIPPDRSLLKSYILKDPVETTTQLSTQYAISEVNTEHAKYVSHGVNHVEGGWPKDININDEEQTLRYRKKIQRDDQYGIQLLGLTKVWSTLPSALFKNCPIKYSLL